MNTQFDHIHFLPIILMLKIGLFNAAMTVIHGLLSMKERIVKIMLTYLWIQLNFMESWFKKEYLI